MQYTLQSIGSSITQVDDSEVMSINELSSANQPVYQMSWSYLVKIIDFRVANSPAQVHQYGLWFSGAKRPGNYYASDFNPNQAGRLVFASVESVFIRPGTIFQIKTAQQSEAGTPAAEKTILAFTYAQGQAGK
jgi:hypothetical protein